MDDRLTPEQKDALIENALRELPFVPMPRDITAGVMARIQASSPQRPFRITWSDLAIALAIALSAGALLFTLQNIPPIMVAEIRKQSILLYQDILVNERRLLPVVLFGLAAFLSALTIPSLFQMTRARWR